VSLRRRELERVRLGGSVSRGENQRERLRVPEVTSFLAGDVQQSDPKLQATWCLAHRLAFDAAKAGRQAQKE